MISLYFCVLSTDIPIAIAPTTPAKISYKPRNATSAAVKPNGSNRFDIKIGIDVQAPTGIAMAIVCSRKLRLSFIILNP